MHEALFAHHYHRHRCGLLRAKAVVKRVVKRVVKGAAVKGEAVKGVVKGVVKSVVKAATTSHGLLLPSWAKHVL
jgi:hypothetical protein|tara:strand:- start:562 stop:783 length:222 start_codon:yes stop_codon:yes gene_type:complete